MNKKEIKEILKKHICTEIIMDESFLLSNDEPLITSGLIDSFSLVYIGVFVENFFGVNIPDIDLTVDKMNTIEAMASRIFKEVKNDRLI